MSKKRRNINWEISPIQNPISSQKTRSRRFSFPTISQSVSQSVSRKRGKTKNVWEVALERVSPKEPWNVSSDYIDFRCTSRDERIQRGALRCHTSRVTCLRKLREIPETFDAPLWQLPQVLLLLHWVPTLALGKGTQGAMLHESTYAI